MAEHNFLIPFENEKYNDYIIRIQQENRNYSSEDYTEKHHIIPKCLNGNNNNDNLIRLYPEEHYYAHKLLALENKNVDKLQCAWWLMSSIPRKNGKRVKISAEEYNKARKNFSNFKTNTRNYIMSEEVRNKIIRSKKESNFHWFTNGTNEVYSKSAPGEEWVRGRKPVNEEIRQKISQAHKGKTPVNKGKPLSEEQKEKIKITRKERGIYGKNALKVIDTNTGVIYGSLREASRETGITLYYISTSCNNKKNKMNIINFKFYEEE